MRIFSILTGIVLLCAPAYAETTRISCELTKLKNSGGWIPSKPVVQFNTETKALKLISPTEDQLNGKIDKKFSRVVSVKKDRIVLRWFVIGTRNKSNQRTSSFRFSARYKPSTKTVEVIAKPQGYANQFKASGTCVES